MCSIPCEVHMWKLALMNSEEYCIVISQSKCLYCDGNGLFLQNTLFSMPISVWKSPKVVKLKEWYPLPGAVALLCWSYILREFPGSKFINTLIIMKVLFMGTALPEFCAGFHPYVLQLKSAGWLCNLVWNLIESTSHFVHQIFWANCLWMWRKGKWTDYVFSTEDDQHREQTCLTRLSKEFMYWETMICLCMYVYFPSRSRVKFRMNWWAVEILLASCPNYKSIAAAYICTWLNHCAQTIDCLNIGTNRPRHSFLPMSQSWLIVSQSWSCFLLLLKLTEVLGL